MDSNWRELDPLVTQAGKVVDGIQDWRTRQKAAAILAGVPGPRPAFADVYDGTPFLKALSDARRGDPEANAYVKSVLGTSDATGQAIVPNSFVASLSPALATRNIFRQLMNVVPGITSAAVDIPYESTAVTAALKQGAYGSNKDVRDWSFDQVTATLYTLAQIADVGNQLLRQSGGAAEASARRRLAASIGMAESNYIVNGSGSSQPLGILQALLNVGDIAANKYALNSEPRVSAIANGLAKLEARGAQATGIVMNPTDFWEMNVETLGTSGAGGWAVDPAQGPSGSAPGTTLWGLPVYRCPDLAAGTALVADWTAFDIYLGSEFRIDVSSEGGNRFDQNVTGFRAEEDFAFNAQAAVATGKVVKVTGL